MDSSAKASQSAAQASEVGRVLRALAGFALLLGAVWVGFFLLARRLPYLASGETVISRTKMETLGQGSLFLSGSTIRVVVFGNSKALAGFQPSTFDRVAGEGVSSYNAGLPGRVQFIRELGGMCERGEVPTHVLLLQPWRMGSSARFVERRATFFHPLVQTNQELVDRLFPFRQFPRDAAMFTLRARRHGGLRTSYESAAAAAREVELMRGYYFIAGQSVYPDDALPEDFELSADQPGVFMLRHVDVASPDLAVLEALAERHDFQVLLVPSYYRRGEYARHDAVDSRTVDLLAPHPRFHVVGPDYWIYPPSNFSDPVHLNRTGAGIYTQALWGLVAPGIRPRDGVKAR